MENQETPIPSPIVSQKPSHGYFVKGLSVLLLVVIAYGLGYQTGHKGFIYNPKDFKVVNQADQPANVDYNLLWKALDVVNSKYIDKPIDQQKALYGAVKGAVESAGDPYTTFFPPKDLTNFRTQLAGSFGGIGAEVGKKDGNIVVIAPLDGSPAQKAGIKSGDIIVKVNGESTQDWSVEAAVEKIRGPKGTPVTLTLFRTGKDKTFDVKIVRDTIAIKSVKWSYKEVTVDGKKKTIAVINLSEFGDDTEGLFNQAVNEVLTKNVSGIILDLRNDPGGYLQTAVAVASNWVTKGDTVVSEAHSDGTSQVYSATGNPRLAGIKTIVMINGGSASASEILSGALRDHNLATLLGEKSFGKGSVQELVDLPGGSAVKVTVAKWITPGGKNLNHNGLDPDIKVTISDDDVKNNNDAQLNKALEEIVK